MCSKILKLFLSVILAVNCIHESSQTTFLQQPAIKALEPQCMQATGAKEDIVAKIHKGEKVINPDQATTCYIQCIFDKLQLLEENGTLRNDALIQFLGHYLGEGEARTLVENCQPTQRTDRCAMAYNTLMCYLENHPEFYR